MDASARNGAHSITCRNRHCPERQSLARAQWLDDCQAQYYKVVFTVPEEIAAMAYQNEVLRDEHAL